MAQPTTPGPRPTVTSTPEVAQSKRDLTSWWRTFKRGNPSRPQEDKGLQGIFGVPLHQSIRYANVAISLFNDEGESYIYGYVPIVVAKCGVFLKEKATDVEGIFRLSGSEKRIKELKLAFDSPDRYGKGLDWTGYTVHDAANILRRYFNQLPEPIIPLDFYERFRDPLRNHQAQAVGPMDLQAPSIGHFDPAEAIRAYQMYITELPSLNRQLLLYILDLLAVFASKSDQNKMTTANLAAIFQPGILSHRQHDMAPAEYRLSQDVLIFLIENQDHFLIGMHGTEADEKTVRDVQSASQSPRNSSPTTPQRSKTVIGRSGSNASAGADSVRRFGNLRRNVSVSSKTSKHSTVNKTPVTPTAIPANVSGGLGRSNTVPSKRSGASSRFHHREKHVDSPSTPSPSVHPTVNTTLPRSNESDESTPIATVPPSGLESLVAATAAPAPPEVISASSSEATTPLATADSDASSTARLTSPEHQIVERIAHPLAATPKSSALSPVAVIHEDARERSPSGNATPTRAFLDIFKPSPTSSDDGRREGRRKLQKKRIPGSSLSSAQSSAHSLQHGTDGTDEQRLISPGSPTFDAKPGEYDHEHGLEGSTYATAQTSPRMATPQRTQTDSTLRPALSPSHSFHTDHDMTDMSDADYATDATHGSSGTPADAGKKKRRWRISQPPTRSRDAADQVMQSPQRNIGNLTGADQSKSTVGSSGAGGRPRRNSQDLAGPSHAATEPAEGVLSDGDERKKGPMSWIRGKIAERKERQDEKQRARSPSKMDANLSRQSLALEVRGKSIDVPRQRSRASARSDVDKLEETLEEEDEQKPA
ncbi:hypothetical protein AAFC00_004833 [Neodothiora populina]